MVFYPFKKGFHDKFVRDMTSCNRVIREMVAGRRFTLILEPLDVSSARTGLLSRA